jgi:hypothetical protein
MAKTSARAWARDADSGLEALPAIAAPEVGLQQFNLIALLTGRWTSFYAGRVRPPR